MLPGSGNSIVDMHERMEAMREASKEECCDCYKGMRILDKEEFKEWLENKFGGYKKIVKEALYFYREWKKTGEVICDTCEGEGYTYGIF